MEQRVRNQLGAVRRQRGLGASDLARRVGVSRQTIHAMESGSYTPNTEVALKLARELEVTVEALFSLEGEAAEAASTVSAELLSRAPVSKGQPVRLCRMGERLIGVPVDATPYYLPEADGVVAKCTRSKADLAVFAKEESYKGKLILAGCDPAVGLLGRMVEKLSGVEVIPAGASSRLALDWLQQGSVHVAGTHLEDAATGEFNLPYLRAHFPGEDFLLVTFASWEEGLVTAAGNPKGIRKVEHLTGKTVRFVNREAGSGSRTLLERLMDVAGVEAKRIRGFDDVALGHLAAAYRVLEGGADCCVATRSAAMTFGLDFVPLRSERYDFAMRRETLEHPAAQAFLDVLQRAALRRKLEVLAGYDTAQTGMVRN